MRGAWAAVAVVLGTATAAAQSSGDAALAATRRGLIDQAEAAREAGDHAGALALAEQAGRIAMSPSLRRFVAEEQSAVGRLAESLGSAERCVTEASRDQASPSHAEHEAACQSLLATLRPRVGRVVLRVDAAAPGMTVRVAGAAVPEVAWGVAYVVTPGDVEVVAEAPGYAPLRRTLAVAAGATSDVPVSLLRLAVVSPRPVAAPRSLNVAPLVVAGAGAVSMALGGVFYALRQDAAADRDAQCSSLGCPESARADHERGETFNTLTNVSLAVGAAAVVGGAVWFIVSPWRRGERAPSARRIGPSPGGAGLTLSF